MPRLNSRGDYCGGVGEGQVHWNEQPLAPVSGGIAWVTDDHVIYQTCVVGCVISLDNVRTNERETVLGHGANHIVGGGGNWAVWFGTGDPNLAGITTASGARYPQGGLGGAMGPDGAWALKVNYQGYGPWDVVESDGTRWRLTDNDAGNINLLGNRRAVWVEPGGATRATGIAPPSKLLPQPNWHLRVLEIRGEWWAMYQVSDGRLVCHPFDSLEGYELAPPGSLTYRPDWVVLPEGPVRIVWAVGEGEWQGQVRRIDRTFNEPRQDLSAGAPVEPPIEPPIEPPVEPPVEPGEPDVDIPDHSDVVHTINEQYPHYLQTNTASACGEFTELVVLELASRYPSEGWGHVRKTGGQTQYRGHAVDAVMSKLDLSKAIDIIGGAEGHPNPGNPGWMEVTSGGQPWMAPIQIAGGGTEPPTTGPPPVTQPPQPPVDLGPIYARLDALEQNAVLYEQVIGLTMKSANRALSVVGGGPSDDTTPVEFVSRSEVHAWESFKVERGEG